MYTIELMFMSGAEDGLNIWLKDHQNQGYAIKDGWEFVLGRGEHCDLVIRYDVQVSREHAFLSIQGGALWLQDHNSSNGTFIQETRLDASAPLAQGILFRIGHTWLRIQNFSA